MKTEKKQLNFIGDAGFQPNMGKRTNMARIWGFIFFLSTVVGILTLVVLFASIINDNFTTVILVDRVPRESLVVEEGKTLEEHSRASMAQIVFDNVHLAVLRTDVLDTYPERVKERAFALGVETYDIPLGDMKTIFLDLYTKEQMWTLIEREVLDPAVEESFTLWETWTQQARIQEVYAEVEAYAQEGGGHARMSFKSWLNGHFLTAEQNTVAQYNGIRAAIIGSILTILIAILVALPVGIAAAVYLEEFAAPNRINKVIQTNIYNLAGVPSIIYGMLGLAIFVRLFEPITSGSMFGYSDSENGRTIIGAGLTLAFLVLPVLIINTQEALRAIPQSLRQSGMAVGATKLRVIWSMVLPQSIDRILTGTVFAISRAIGETAPLVVVGASTFVTQDPTSIFSKFTTLPMQIYYFASDPNPEFRHVSAAAILVLLGLLLAMNATAIVLRNYYRSKKDANG